MPIIDDNVVALVQPRRSGDYRWFCEWKDIPKKMLQAWKEEIERRHPGCVVRLEDMPAGPSSEMLIPKQAMSTFRELQYEYASNEVLRKIDQIYSILVINGFAGPTRHREFVDEMNAHLDYLRMLKEVKDLIVK